MAEDSEAALPAGLERKLATILSADVAGYSRLMAEDEEATLRTFRGHREVFEQLVALHRGRVFNTAGDAILAEFASAVEAVRCATEIQAALATRNEQLPTSRQVRFRIGVNLGDVMVQGSDLMGDGVNVAARLQAAAEPGGVCISGSIYDQIRNKLSLTFRSLGEQSFKNIPQPVRTFSISGTEGHGALPAARKGRRGALVVIGGLLALAVVGIGGYWGYAELQRGRAEQARLLEAAASARLAAEEAQRRADAERQAAEAVRRESQIAADRARAEQALRAAEADKKRAEDDARRATLALKREEDLRKKEDATRGAVALAPASSAPAAPPAAANPPSGGAAAPTSPNLTGLDGLYTGRVCYGATETEKRRCYRAEGTVAGGKIAGRWSGRDPGLTMILAGLVSATGDVQMEIHGERADRPRSLTILLSGSLRDGKLEASGQFANGRPATLSWQRQ